MFRLTSTLALGLVLAIASTASHAQSLYPIRGIQGPKTVPHGHDSTWIKEIRTPPAPPAPDRDPLAPCTTAANTLKTLGCPAPAVGSFSGMAVNTAGGIPATWTVNASAFRAPTLANVLKEAEYLMRAKQPQMAAGGYTIDDYSTIKGAITAAWANLAIAGNTNCALSGKLPTPVSVYDAYVTVGMSTYSPFYFGTPITGQNVPYFCKGGSAWAQDNNSSAPGYFLRYCSPSDGAFAITTGCTAQAPVVEVDEGGCMGWDSYLYAVGDRTDSCSATGSPARYRNEVWECQSQTRANGTKSYGWVYISGGLPLDAREALCLAK